MRRFSVKKIYLKKMSTTTLFTRPTMYSFVLFAILFMMQLCVVEVFENNVSEYASLSAAFALMVCVTFIVYAYLMLVKYMMTVVMMFIMAVMVWFYIVI